MARINLEDIYKARSLEELRETYDGWADAYDEQMYDDYGHLGCKLLVEHVGPLLATNAVILDAGAGTGTLGEALHGGGFKVIDGIDMSAGMLEQARAKGVYRHLGTAVLGERLDFPDDGYDAILSSGVFTVGHAPPESFYELIRITRKGGLIGFTMRDDERPEGFVAMFERLEADGSWRKVHESEPHSILSRGDARYTQRYWGFEVI